MTIALPRSTLVAAGLYCFLAGLCLGNAVAAWDAGRSPLWSGAAALIAAGLAVHLVRAATRPRPAGPVPRPNRPPAT